MLRCLMPITLLTTPVAIIAEPGPDWISIGRVEAILAHEGYRLIEIEAKDDAWEGEATRHGRTWDFTMNPKSGRIITTEADD